MGAYNMLNHAHKKDENQPSVCNISSANAFINSF